VTRHAGGLFAEADWQIWHVPGFSRSWRREFPDRCYLLVTNIDGFDLPESGGPYAALSLSPYDDVLYHETFLPDSRELMRWVRRMERMNGRPGLTQRSHHFISNSTDTSERTS
jgi:hypothetical protein